MTLAQTVFGYILTYFMYGMQGSFLYIILASWGLGMVGNSAAMMLGCAISEVKNVAESAPLLFVPQILFGGFFVRTSQIPAFMRWCQYLCGMKYAMNLAFMIEFDLELDHCQASPEARINCKNILDSNDIEPDRWYVYVVLMGALYLGYRLLAGYILYRAAKKFY